MTKKIIAIVLGAVASMMLGAIWYTLFQPTWLVAVDMTLEEALAGESPFIYMAAAVVWLASAFAVGTLFDKIGDRSWKGVLSLASLVWLSIGITSTVLTTLFGDRGLNLLWIDGLYTLVCLCVILSIRKLIDR